MDIGCRLSGNPVYFTFAPAVVKPRIVKTGETKLWEPKGSPSKEGYFRRYLHLCSRLWKLDLKTITTVLRAQLTSQSMQPFSNNIEQSRWKDSTWRNSKTLELLPINTLDSTKVKPTRWVSRWSCVSVDSNSKTSWRQHYSSSSIPSPQRYHVRVNADKLHSHFPRRGRHHYYSQLGSLYCSGKRPKNFRISVIIFWRIAE